MTHLIERTLVLEKGPLQLFFQGGWLNLYWQGRKLTENCGINASMNTAGIWSDSSHADWYILERSPDRVVLKNIWRNLPVTLIWNLRVNEDYEIAVDIDMQTEEYLEIDERRLVVFVSALYTTWVNSYEEGRFPQIIGWQDMPLTIASSRSVGVRFARDAELVHAV